MDIKKLRERAMYNPRSLTEAEWDTWCEEAFRVPTSDPTEKVELKPKRKQGKQWW